MSTTTIDAADMRPVDLFDDLDDAARAEFAAAARPLEARAGEVIAEPGASIGVILLLDGVVRTLIPAGERADPTGQHHAPTWLGAIGALTRGSLGVRVQAETDCRMGVIAPDDFRRLAFAHTAVHDRVMRQVGPVMSRITAIEHNRERLASLGTMAAGLAHELNNPAAAATRAAAQMAEALETVSATIGHFVHSGIERADAAKLVELHDEVVGAAALRTALDALGAADAEDDLIDRLEALGVREPWDLAEPLAAAGVDGAWLDRVHALAGPATDAAVRWVAATLAARGLAAELQESTERMSRLVGAVKTYAYMDRGALVEVDLHEGIETTLVVLGHKLKHTSIEVVRDYDRSLPKLTVRGSELNQVWTNLIDNAIQALGEHGTIAIRTHREGSCAVVEISDDGPGIPPDIREHVFDEFFTTKPAGYGTGLGLATAKQIVADRHDGSLTVASKPGRTTFRVSLPFTQRA